jgi:hypothetical protein
MATRSPLILLLVLLATVAIGWLGLGWLDAELPVPPGGPAIAVEASSGARPAAPPAAAVLDGDGAPVAATWTPAARQATDTKDWTSGIVRGDVQIAVAVLPQIESISVVVEELRSAIAPDGSFQHPHRMIVPVKLGIGTPTFEVRNIPFSDYPYTVRLYSPGLNGGSRTLTIDKQTPLHEDVVLAITPGAPFSVLLRDQDLNPLPQIDVRLVPHGDPPGRKSHQGTSDNYGVVVFESVLAGDYQVRMAQDHSPLDESQLITVEAGNRMYGNKVQGQSHVVTLARGQALSILVTQGPSFGLEGAHVRLMPTDRHRLIQLEDVTDYAGNVRFPRLQPGVWQIDVWKDNYERRTRQITIKEGEAPPQLQVQLVRLR